MAVGNAQLLSQTAVLRWIIENNPKKLQFLHQFVFNAVDGGALQVARTDATDVAEFVSGGGALTDQTADIVSPATSFEFALAATRFRIGSKALEAYSQPTDQDAAQAVQAIRRMLYLFAQECGAVTPDPNGFGSFADLSSRTIDKSAAALAWADLLDLFYLIDDNEGSPTMIVSDQESQRKGIIAAASGPDNMLTWEPAPWVSPNGKRPKMPYLMGVPWFINGLQVPTAGIFAMVNGDSGMGGPGHGLCGIVPATVADNWFVRREVQVAGDATTEVQYSWPVGLSLGSKAAMGRLFNFT